MFETVVAGTRLILLGERIIYWPDASTMFLADAHFGKAATFRKAGLPVPAGTTQSMLTRLSSALERWRPKRLIVLGDLIHSQVRSARDFEEELVAWRSTQLPFEWLLVRGNHDRGCQRLFQDLQIEVVDEAFRCGPFALCHYPESRSTCTESYHLAGHLHPGVNLSICGQRSSKLPCYWFQKEVAVLPAFGEFTGLAAITPSLDDRVFVIASGEVLDVSNSVFAGETRRS